MEAKTEELIKHLAKLIEQHQPVTQNQLIENLTWLVNESRRVERNIKLDRDKKLTLSLNEDVDFLISKNRFGELVINKQQYGASCSEILIKPSVSNEIRLT